MRWMGARTAVAVAALSSLVACGGASDVGDLFDASVGDSPAGDSSPAGDGAPRDARGAGEDAAEASSPQPDAQVDAGDAAGDSGGSDSGGGDASPSDSGGPDAGGDSSTMRDAAMGDASTEDAGDSGAADSGAADSGAGDSGAGDAGNADGGMDASGAVCEPPCDVGRKCCNGACVNPTNDIHNCGQCGNVCGGAHPFCNGSTCGDPPCSSGTACPGTEFCCASQCCAEGTLCCQVPSGVVTGPQCTTPVNGTCPQGCDLCP